MMLRITNYHHDIEAHFRSASIELPLIEERNASYEICDIQNGFISITIRHTRDFYSYNIVLSI